MKSAKKNDEYLLPESIQHNILIVNINNTYKEGYTYNNYQGTRKGWTLAADKIKNVDYVLGECKGTIRTIYKPIEWERYSNNKMGFIGEEVKENAVLDMYLNKKIQKKPQDQSVKHYFWNKNKKEWER